MAEQCFKGKVAMVTGAGQGIGREVAKALSASGAKTYAVSRTQEHLDTLKQEMPEMNCVCVDLSDWKASREILEKIEPVDLLVNNAGISVLDSFLECPEEHIDKLFNVNVKGVINVSQIFAKHMKNSGRGGSIVNVSSIVSNMAADNHLSYCLCKGALDQVTRVMALELGPHKIRVNSVNPTVVLTAMGKMAWSDPNKSEPLLNRIPAGKFAEVDDVVNAVTFLLSDKSSYLNGTFIPIDGGLTCH